MQFLIQILSIEIQLLKHYISETVVVPINEMC